MWPDRYPHARIDVLIRAVKGSRYLRALDLKSRSWEVLLDPESCRYTAFLCSYGFYEFIAMPLEIVNVPAIFQRLIDLILGNLRGSGVPCYLYDVVFHHEDYDKCLELLAFIVLQRLREHGLTVNIKKSVFFPKEIKYLGQILGGGEVRPDPAKVAVLERIATARTLHGMRAVFGFLGWRLCSTPLLSKDLVSLFRCPRSAPNTLSPWDKTPTS